MNHHHRITVWLLCAAVLCALVLASQAHWTRQTPPPDAEKFWKSAIVIDHDDASDVATTSTRHFGHNTPKNEDILDADDDDVDGDERDIQFASDLASADPSKTNTESATTTGPIPSKREPFQIQNFYFEIGCLVLVTVFIINFMIGSSQNRNLFNSIFATARPLFSRNFSSVGNPIRENSSFYRVVCTGRRNCEGMCATVELKRRQDLFAHGWYILFPTHDFVSVDVPFGSGVTDPYVLCIFRKNRESSLREFCHDITDFSLTAKSWVKLPKQFALFAENSAEIFDRIIDKFESTGLWDNLEYIHVTDQGIYTPQSKHCMRIVMRISSNPAHQAKFEHLFRMILEMIDVVARINLPSAAREKNVSKRNAIEEEKKKKIAEEKKKKEDEKKQTTEKKSAATLEREEKKREKKEAKKRLPKVKVMYG